jgi:hypothetical protein
MRLGSTVSLEGLRLFENYFHHDRRMTYNIIKLSEVKTHSKAPAHCE